MDLILLFPFHMLVYGIHLTMVISFSSDLINMLSFLL